ncbi:MAG: TRAP transporter substrate-binding protein DctP, partial [Dehalococcoidia bacterium]|nr:TRAP transporter substrate-binding protein DctP [Dehalococcoidia bacterium]
CGEEEATPAPTAAPTAGPSGTTTAAPTTAPTVQQEAKVVTWKIQGCVPAGMIYHTTLEAFAKRVEEASGGRMKLEVYPAGAVVKTMEGLTGVSKGIIQANYAYSALWMGKIPAAPLLCSVPCDLNDVDMYLWLTKGGGMDLYQEMYDTNNFNVKVFLAGIVGIQNFQWTNDPIATIDDMKGVKLRMMPPMGDVLKENGMSVAFLSAAEIMPALERGVIDGAEFASSAFDYSAGYHEVCKYHTVPGIHQPSSVLEITVNKDAWNDLPTDLQYIWQNCCDAHIWECWGMENWANLDAEEAFIENGNVAVQLTPETIATLTDWTAKYFDEKSAEDPFFAKVRKSQVEFGKRWYPFRATAFVPYDALMKWGQ